MDGLADRPAAKTADKITADKTVQTACKAAQTADGWSERPTTGRSGYRPIDYALWARAFIVLGRPRAVTLWTCPRCGEDTLVWSGREGDGCHCLNRKCGLQYDDFADLVNGQEAYLAALKEKQTRELMERHDTYRRVRGAIRQVRHA